VDLAPIVHLFKSQVYQLAECLEIPASIRSRTPTSDTYSAGSTQEEFFFRVPFAVLDLVWAGFERQAPPTDIATALELTPEQVERVIDDITRKQRTTRYLRLPALTAHPAAQNG
jgi:NAD+ synthase